MADETIIIDVQFNSSDVAKKLGDVNKKINELTATNRQLREEIKNGNDLMGENSLKLAENESILKSLNNEKRNYLGIVEEEITANKHYGTSINDLKDKLRSLTATYNSLSEEERNSQFGKNIRDAAKQTQEEISKLNQKIGNYRDNVGNYKSAFLDFFSKVGGKWKDLGKLFTSNPIGIAITALILIFNKLKESFEKGDEAGKKLKNAMSNLQPIFNVFNSVISAVVNAVASLIEAFSELVNWVFPNVSVKFMNIAEISKEYATYLEQTANLLKLVDYNEALLNANSKKRAYEREKILQRLSNTELSVEERFEALEELRKLELNYNNDLEKLIMDRVNIREKEAEKLNKVFKKLEAAYGEWSEYFAKLTKNQVNSEEQLQALQKAFYESFRMYLISSEEDAKRAWEEYRKYAINVPQSELKRVNEQVKSIADEMKKVADSLGINLLELTKDYDALFEIMLNIEKVNKDIVKWNKIILTQSMKEISGIEKLEFDYITNKVKRENLISELRKKSLDEENYTFEERVKFLDDAIELEKQNLSEELKIAETNANIFYTIAKRFEDNSKETLNKIKENEANILKLRYNYNARVAELEEERIATTKKNLKAIVEQTEALAKQASDAAIDAMVEGRDKEIAKLEMSYAEELDMLKKKEDEIKKILEQANTLGYNISESDLAKLNQQLDDIAALRILKETELQNSLLNIKKQYSETELQAEFTAIENKYAMEIQLNRRKEVELAEIDNRIAREYRMYLQGLTQEQIDSLFISEEAYKLALVTAMQEEEAAIEKRNQLLANHVEKTLSAINNLLGSVSSLFDAFDAESESSKNAQKAIAVAQFAFSSAAALAKGISEASAAGPFPYNLTAIATTVATILTNLATAKKFFNEKSSGYASGGIVPGTSYTGDRVTANVNSGEMILTREQQKALFRMANTNLATNNNYDLLVSGLSEALKNQPNPVLNYEEFTNFTNDIANKNKLILRQS